MYKITKISSTPFGYPKNIYFYFLNEDGLYYDIDGLGGISFDKNKHKIESLEYNSKLYHSGEDGVDCISFRKKVISTNIINFFEYTEYSSDYYLCIKTKDLANSIWINSL
jgi:hypothetical protein